jgi:glycosyltransferase involved in cell wall biosynthesis
VRGELGVHAGERLIVSVARLHPQKALDVMLEALALLPVDVTLAVVGDGPQAGELSAYARRLGVDGRVRWVGQRDDAVDFIAASDVFCLSSVWEAVPLAAQEAVLLGVPVVATAVGGLGELIEDGRSGRLVPVGDSSALAKVLAETLANDDLRESYARDARSHYDRTFSRDAILDRLRHFYLDDYQAR